MRIGYKVFGQNSLNYGLAYCLYKNNLVAEPVTEATAACYDVVLFSIFWWQHVIDFVEFCDNAKIGKHLNSKTRVVVGGFNACNPVIFKKYAHAVVVGDGDDIIKLAINGESHPSIYTGEQSEIIYNQADISENSFIYCNEAKISRIEIARGCKYHCRFCQLSAMKKYREVSYDTIAKSLANAKEKRTALFAPNKTSHSRFPDIVKLIKSSGKIDVVPDVRYNDVEKFYGRGTIQIGVEGISERLRFMVGKQFTDERFREIVKFLIDKTKLHGGRPHMHTGFIMDLPTETDDDWRQFTALLDGLENISGINRFCIFFVFNMFMPAPFTPYEDEEIHYERNYPAKLKQVLGRNRKFAVHVPGRLFSNYNRILSMITTRGDEHTPDIIKDIKASVRSDLPDGKKIPPLKFVLKKYGGIERFTGKPTEKPWRIVKIVHRDV